MLGNSLIKKIVIFFTIVFALFGVFYIGSYAVGSLMWNGLQIETVAPTFISFVFLLFLYISDVCLKKWGVGKVSTLVYLFAIGVLLSLLSVLVLPLLISGVVVFSSTIPAIVMFLAIYSIWMAYNYSENAFLSKYKKFGIILFAGLLFSSVSILEYDGLDWIQNSRAEAGRQKNLAISLVSDELLFTKNGNPVGVKFIYSVRAQSKEDVIINRYGFESGFIKKAGVDRKNVNQSFIDLQPLPYHSDINPASDGRIIVGKVYVVTTYAVPMFLHYNYNPEAETINDKQVFDTERVSCGSDISREVNQYFNNYPDNYFGAGGYSQTFSFLKDGVLTTNNLYDPVLFYKSLVKEGICK